MNALRQCARLSSLLLGLAVALSAAAAEHGAHQHGVARLDVAIDGPTLLISLDSPLANLLGFEHALRNDRERAAVGTMEAALRSPGALQPNPEAGCRLGEVLIAHSFQAAAGPGQPAGTPAAAGHADAEVSWTYRCAAPTALRQLDVALFERFSGLRSLRVQLAGPRGQSASVLSRKQRRLVW